MQLAEAEASRDMTARDAVVGLIVARETQVAAKTPELDAWPDLATSRQLNGRHLRSVRA